MIRPTGITIKTNNLIIRWCNSNNLNIIHRVADLAYKPHKVVGEEDIPKWCHRLDQISLCNSSWINNKPLKISICNSIFHMMLDTIKKTFNKMTILEKPKKLLIKMAVLSLTLIQDSFIPVQGCLFNHTSRIAWVLGQNYLLNKMEITIFTPIKNNFQINLVSGKYQTLLVILLSTCMRKNSSLPTKRNNKPSYKILI